MKKITAIIICISLIISIFSVNVAAEKADEPIGTVPTVLVTGFLCSKLYINYGTENEESIWSDILAEVPSQIFGNIKKVASSLFKLVKGENEEFGKAAAEGALELLENIKCNPDGTSANNISHYPNNPAVSNLEYMFEHSEKYIYEKKFCEYLSTVTDPSAVFPFNYDSRIDAVILAQELDKYIDLIRSYTGASKVNVFALSYGGLITATYLSMYGEKNAVDRLVMAVPALGGTDIPEKILRGTVDFADEDLISFVETILGNESNYARIFEKDRVEWLDEFAQGFCKNLGAFVANWGSVWSLCASDVYDELKSDFLDENLNAKIIANADYIHYTVRPGLIKIFEEAKSRGTQISLICGTGSDLVTGGKHNGDVILPASCVSGAVCSEQGKRFPSDYRGVYTVCKNRTHNHISPSMEVDATSAYLPENTWFVEGLFHGQYNYEEYTRSLITKLLYTDEIKDVYSDADYPQFEYSNHINRGVHATFKDASAGFYSGEDELVITSLSEDCYIKILSVLSDGVELEFDVSQAEILKPGESVAIPVLKSAESSACYGKITVSYFKIGSLTPLCVNEFYVTANGDCKKEGEAENLFSGFETRLSQRVPEKFYNLLLKFSLVRAAECIYNTYIYIKQNH